MTKRLIVALFAFAALAAAAKTARADSGDSCTTVDGRSGYMFATGFSVVCVPNDGQ